MESYINSVWDYMMNKLFSQNTKTFYDFAVPGMIGEFEKYLPSPEVIALGFPNTCGWCTGMEDGCINGGVMLESALTAYEYTGDKKFILIIKDIFEGLKKCAEVSDQEGFLARNVSPVDGTSHYCNSSRDQYTHWISACCMYYESGLCPENDKAFIRKTLCAFAKRAEENVIEENGWSLLDENGRKGLVLNMWGNIMPHEMMRLPMFYIAAWRIGGDEHFKDLYLEYRDKAIEKSEQIDFSKLCRPFAANQMQLSLKTAYTYDTDEAFRKRCMSLMKRLAQYGYDTAVSKAKDTFSPERLSMLSYRPKPWHQVLAAAGLDVIANGYAYYTPLLFKSLHPEAPQAAWLIRDIADSVSIYTSCPDTGYCEEMMDALKSIANAVDLDNHFTDAPGSLLLPYYTMMKRISK